MPLQARFVADFSSFSAAVDAAQTQLKDFESGAGKVGTALNRMVDQFSGRQLIQQATEMAKAIGDIGGPTALTDAELQKASKTIDEATAKMKLLGIEAPASFKGISDAAAETRASTESMFGEFVSGLPVVEGLVAAFSADRIIAFGESAIEAASNFKNLAAATGLSTDDVQRFNYVAPEFGLNIDTMARGVEQLSAKLAGGDKSATLAVQMLGLSVKDLIAEGPKEAFLDVADAASRLEDPMTKAGVASDLFGGRLAKQLLPALGQLRDKINDVPKGAIVSEDDINKAHDLETGVKQLWTEVEAYTDKAIAAAAATASWLNQRAGHPGINVTAAQFGGLPSGGTGGALPSTPISPAGALIGPTPISDAQALEKALESLRANAVEPLTASQQANVSELEKLGISEAESAKLVGASVEAVHLYVQAQKDAAAAAKQAATDQARFNDQVLGATVSFLKATGSLHDFTGIVPDLTEEQTGLQDRLSSLDGTWNEFHKGITIAGDELTSVTIPAFGTLPNVIPQSTKALEDARNAAVDLSGTLEGALDQALQSLPRILSRAFTDGQGIQGAVKQFGDVLGTDLGKVIESPDGPIASILPKSLDNVFGAAIGSVAGGLAGAGVSALVSLFTNIGGPSKTEVQGEQTEAQFEQQMGGWQGIQKALTGVGVSASQANAMIQALWNSEKQGSAAVQTQIDAINNTIQTQTNNISAGVQSILTAAQAVGGQAPAALQPLITKLEAMPGITDDEKKSLDALLGSGPDLQTITDTASKYGLTLDDLGSKTQQLSISSQADQIETDYNTLVNSGANVGAVQAGMAKSFGDLVESAEKYGSTLPTALQPVIDSLFDSGQLADSTGTKIDDISGLKFDDSNDPLAQSLSTLNDTLTTLIDTLSGKIPKAAQDGAKGISDSFSNLGPFDVDVNYNTGGSNYASRGGLVTPFGIQYFKSGGNVLPFMPRGTDTVPAMLTPGEMVLTPDQQRAAFAGQPIVVVSQINLEGKQIERVVTKYQTRDLHRRRKVPAA